MIIQLEIPKEFAKDYANNRFDDFFRHSEGAIKRRILDLGINKKPVRCPPPENGRRTRWKPCAAW